MTELILPSEAPPNRRASAISRVPSMSVKNLLDSSVARSPVPRYVLHWEYVIYGHLLARCPQRGATAVVGAGRGKGQAAAVAVNAVGGTSMEVREGVDVVYI